MGLGCKRSPKEPPASALSPKEAGNSIGCLGRNFPARVA